MGFWGRAAAEGGTDETGAEAMIERAATLIVFGLAVLSLLGALWPVQYGVFACYGSAFCEVVPGYGDTDSQSCNQMAYLGNHVWEQMGANRPRDARTEWPQPHAAAGMGREGTYAQSHRPALYAAIS